MVDITARIITDSIGEHSPRLTTFLTRYPKFIHAEHCRHRAMSLCVSSSRAVPVKKNLEEVRSDELRASPVYWGSEQKGMQSGEELSNLLVSAQDQYDSSPRGRAKGAWKGAALSAVRNAEILLDLGVHKSIVNRLLEPFLHVNVLVTCAEPGLLNFSGLRLDKGAQPEIRTLAACMWAAWNESTPKLLKPGSWHLPFIENEDVDFMFTHPLGHITEDEFIIWARKVSAARCARLSYTSFETGRRSTIEEDLKLFDRLLGANPIHASPAEHQATPDIFLSDQVDLTNRRLDGWKNPHLHGNLPGWIQHRKTFPGEAIAPLPEGYTYVRHN